MCDEANLLERFMRAQRCEERADEAGAAEHYCSVSSQRPAVHGASMFFLVWRAQER